MTYALSCNLHRRHLSTTQRSSVAAKLATLKEGRPSINTPQNCGVSVFTFRIVDIWTSYLEES